MYISRTRLGVILVAGVLLNLAGNALAHRTAVWLLCPEPGVSLRSFDLLRAGMSRNQILARLDPTQLAVENFAVNLHGRPFCFQGPDVWTFRGNAIELHLAVNDGILTDSKAVVKGEVVRNHLQPNDPITDPVRLGLRQLEWRFGDIRLVEILSFPVAMVAAIWLFGALVAARQACAVREPRRQTAE